MIISKSVTMLGSPQLNQILTVRAVIHCYTALHWDTVCCITACHQLQILVSGVCEVQRSRADLGINKNRK